MYLAEVKAGPDVREHRAADIDAAIAGWRDWPASTISHHGRACCDIAREWVLAIDYSQLNAGNILTGPRWLCQRYRWGPSPWPIHWCEAVTRDHLDCGALAAISRELFTARGVESFPAQMIQRFDLEAARHWRETWNEESITTRWIDGNLVYHEGCAVLLSGDEIKLWDSSIGCWIDPKQIEGYGALLAIRIFAARDPGLTWGAQRIAPNEWQKVAAA